MKMKATLIVMVLFALGTVVFANDLFEEAGHELGKSRWVLIRFLPAIEIALEADDLVLVKSIGHPAKGFAMKIDGQAVAADCEVIEAKDTEYTVATESKNKWTTGTTTTSTTYWSKCGFSEGIADKAIRAGEILVQVAMTNGATKPHQLKPKELRKFQALK